MEDATDDTVVGCFFSADGASDGDGVLIVAVLGCFPSPLEEDEGEDDAVDASPRREVTAGEEVVEDGGGGGGAFSFSSCSVAVVLDLKAFRRIKGSTDSPQSDTFLMAFFLKLGRAWTQARHGILAHRKAALACASKGAGTRVGVAVVSVVVLLLLFIKAAAASFMHSCPKIQPDTIMTRASPGYCNHT